MLIKTLSQIIISVLTDPSTLEDSKTKPEYFTRIRKMTFVDLCQFLIWHRKRSTQTAIALFTFFTKPFRKFELMSEQAVSKARNHIN